MKTEKISHVPQGEVVKKLAELVEQSGNQGDAAKAVGTTKQEVSNVLRLYRAPTAKMLRFFGLEAKTIYIHQGK